MAVAQAINIIWVAMIILLIFAYEYEYADLLKTSIALTIFSGLVYYILVFNSELYVALKNMQKADDLPLTLEKLFKQPPKYTFEVQNYHTGGKHHRSIVTRVDQLPITFSYWRDVSKEFDLGIMASSDLKKKPYVYLTLSVEIEIAEDGTKEEIARNIEEFKAIHKHDFSQYYNEIKELDGLIALNMIKVGERDPCMFGIGWFYFFSILPLFIFYSWYAQRFYTEYDFCIRKLISKFSDLSQSQYAGRDPCVKIDENTKHFCFFGKLEVPPQLPIANTVVINTNNIPVGQVIYDPNNPNLASNPQVLNPPSNNGAAQSPPNASNYYNLPAQTVQIYPIIDSNSQNKNSAIPITNT